MVEYGVNANTMVKVSSGSNYGTNTPQASGNYANSGSSGSNKIVRNRPCETVVDSETGYNKVVCQPNPTCADACVNTLKTKVAAIDAKVAAAEVTKLAEVSAALSKSLSAKRAAYNEYTAADIASVNECNGKC